MLSATRKLAMTHRSFPRWISVSAAVWGEGLLGHARHVEQPRRDDKSATPCEHGSIGEKTGMPPCMDPASYFQFIR